MISWSFPSIPDRLSMKLRHGTHKPPVDQHKHRESGWRFSFSPLTCVCIVAMVHRRDDYYCSAADGTIAWPLAAVQSKLTSMAKIHETIEFLKHSIQVRPVDKYLQVSSAPHHTHTQTNTSSSKETEVASRKRGQQCLHTTPRHSNVNGNTNTDKQAQNPF